MERNGQLTRQNAAQAAADQYIEPLSPDDRDLFLCGKEAELHQLLKANSYVLRRLKERD